MKRCITVFLFALLIPIALWAQSANQALYLEFVDGTEFSVTNPAGAQFFYAKGGILEGDTIPLGSIISTGANTQAVLKLKPNGTVIKLAKNTSFKVDLLATSSGGKNTFTLVLGKVRTVAAIGSNYEIKTGSTVCGVRGTDFVLAYEEGKKALLMVAEGTVEFSGIAGGNSILVGKGQFAEFFSNFTPQAFTEAMFNAEYGDMGVPVSSLPASAEPQETKKPETPETPTPVASTPEQPEPVATTEQIGRASCRERV